MGYTHYFGFTKPGFTDEQWNNLTQAATYLRDTLKQPIILGVMQGLGKGDYLTFNGNTEELCHEDFIIERHKGEPLKFNFCKTAQKPYDASVVAMLKYLNHITNGDLTWSSDGDGEANAFNEGEALYRRLLTRPAQAPTTPLEWYESIHELPEETGYYLCKFEDGSMPETFEVDEEDLEAFEVNDKWTSPPRDDGTHYWAVKEWARVVL